MYHLYFKKHDQEPEEVQKIEASSKAEAIDKATEFIGAWCKDNWPESYYIRIGMHDTFTSFDFGSHIDFFCLKEG